MENSRIGTQTVKFNNKPKMISNYSVVGTKEGNGPFRDYFDYILKDDCFSEKTFELAERKLMEHAVFGAIDKAKLTPSDIDMFLSGDLLNQIISASFTARKFNTTFIGLFGACSTMTESIALGASLVNAGYFNTIVCATCSHYASAERQFRFPLELGSQKPPTAQWTVTGSGATVLSLDGKGPYIDMATFGKVCDYGIIDVNNMGAAMAPAAMHTLKAHFEDTKRKPSDYDLIVTGDLGKHGSEILIDLMEKEGYPLSENYCDCGHLIFDKEQKAYMGGSGCGCSAALLNSFFVNKLKLGEYKRILFLSTGALMSPLSSQQGETIPGIAHAIVIERGDDFDS